MGKKPKSAEVRAKFFTARQRGDVEAGGRRGWRVEDDRALLDASLFVKGPVPPFLMVCRCSARSRSFRAWGAPP
jgi:hypothetical protein